MKAQICDLLVKASKKPRMLLDGVLYAILKCRNNWAILDQYVGKDILVVGNGPSLNKTPLDRINLVSIGMNKINLIFDKTTWRPDVIVCVNGLVIRQNKEFFNSTKIPLVLSIRAVYLGIKIRPNVILVRSNRTVEFSESIRDGVGIGSTVTYTALQVAGHLQPKKVNIVGVDNSFKVSGNPNEIQRLDQNDSNHFDPNYFKNQCWGLPDLKGSEEAYLIAKEYFLSKGIQVTDYTVNGRLQVFEKGEVDTICT